MSERPKFQPQTYAVSTLNHRLRHGGVGFDLWIAANVSERMPGYGSRQATRWPTKAEMAEAASNNQEEPGQPSITSEAVLTFGQFVRDRSREGREWVRSGFLEATDPETGLRIVPSTVEDVAAIAGISRTQLGNIERNRFGVSSDSLAGLEEALGFTVARETSQPKETARDPQSPSAVVRSTRIALGLSQRQFAKLLGYSRVKTVQEIENGSRQPTTAIEEKVALLRAQHQVVEGSDKQK